MLPEGQREWYKDLCYSQRFFNLKVKVCDGLKRIAAFTEAVLKGGSDVI